MKTVVVGSKTLKSTGRLDCWYYISPANTTVSDFERARDRGLSIRPLGGPNGVVDRINHPKRFKRALAAIGERSLPYLRPYDAFNYFPEAADFVSASRTENLDEYHLKTGQILQTRSGRNLGPAVYVDSYLSSFVMSDDMIRLEVSDKRMRYYVLAFLNSIAGRRLLRRDKTGSVIDHLSEDQVSKQEIVFFGSEFMQQVEETVERAIELRESARVTLSAMLKKYEEALPPLHRTGYLCDGWTLRSHELEGRLDAAYYDPLVFTIRRQLVQIGGKRVSDFAKVLKPAGRYKTCYVSSEHGRPLLSGAQLLQTSPINLQFMSPGVFKKIADYELHHGWIAYTADGRAEEELGTPVFITRDRDGWLASGHVGRLIPKPGVDPGWLFLALKTSHAQIQLKARASGSVVDSTFVNDIEEVILPPSIEVNGQQVVQLWEEFCEAQELEERGSALIDEALRQS